MKLKRPKRISVVAKPDGSLEVFERPVRGARVFEEIEVSKAKKPKCSSKHVDLIDCGECGEELEVTPKSTVTCVDCIASPEGGCLEPKPRSPRRVWLVKVGDKKYHESVANYPAAIEYVAKLPRRPLQVGERVSFEGYDHLGNFETGKGTLRVVEDKEALVQRDDSWTYCYLGLRSFRRLVPKKTKGSK